MIPTYQPMTSEEVEAKKGQLRKHGYTEYDCGCFIQSLGEVPDYAEPVEVDDEEPVIKKREGVA